MSTVSLPVRLHLAPRLGELGGAGDLEAAAVLVHPGDHPRIVGRVVQQVSEHMQLAAAILLTFSHPRGQSINWNLHNNFIAK